MIVRMNADILNGYIKHKLSTINMLYSIKTLLYSPPPPATPITATSTKQPLFSVPKVAFFFILFCQGSP